MGWVVVRFVGGRVRDGGGGGVYGWAGWASSHPPGGICCPRSHRPHGPWAQPELERGGRCRVGLGLRPQHTHGHSLTLSHPCTAPRQDEAAQQEAAAGAEAAGSSVRPLGPLQMTAGTTALASEMETFIRQTQASQGKVRLCLFHRVA